MDMRKFPFLSSTLLFVLCFVASYAMNARNLTTDQQALLEFKHRIIDPQNILTKNWTTTFPLCNWVGVSCAAKHRRVRALNLSNMGLTGTIPPHIGNLSFLSSLDLSVNNFHGNFPKELGQLSRLKVIELSHNFFTGKIPKWFERLDKVLYLNLSSNNLTGTIPQSIANLSNLEILDLKFNLIHGCIPHEISNLQNLNVLRLAFNQLSGSVPSAIYNISSLHIISLSFNNLSGSLSKDICRHLPNFEALYLQSNELFGQIPSRIDECKNLQILSLGRNRFSGNIPRTTGNLTRLKVLYLSGNYLEGEIPWEIRNLISLEELMASLMHLNGLIPPSIFNISSLKVIDLTLNSLSGSFGSVYKGILSDGTNIAIKVFSLQIDESFRCFDAECEVMSNILHRNLVKVITCCSAVDFKALVLEFMPNGSLEKWLYSCGYFLDILQRINIMIDVGCALEYLHLGHSRPVIHCDLKPSNVLLDKDMVARVGDFGLAKLLGEEDSIKQTMTLATIGYMAPEYGSMGIVSVKSDVYSYGILLMEVFTRKKPTDENFAGEMSMKHWMKSSLSNGIIGIVDSKLLHVDGEHFVIKANCVTSIMGLALDCSAESPDDRIDMKHVVSMLKNIKRKFLNNIA